MPASGNWYFPVRNTPAGSRRDQATLFETNMKPILRISLILNLILLASLIFLLVNQRKQTTVPLPVLPRSKPLVQTPITHSAVTTERKPAPFRWSQLEAAKSYRTYIANLRAIGCPEPTVEDIVRGDADRAFSWERHRLGLDGSGTGSWSRAREIQLVASLLGAHASEETAALAQSAKLPGKMNGKRSSEVVQASVPSSSTTAGSPSYPLFLQDVNWHTLGFTPDQQAAILQVRRQFQSATANLNPNASETTGQNPDAASPSSNASNPVSGDSAALTQWQKALQNANDQLRDALGAQAYLAYEQQQYNAWFKSQLVAAGGGHLTINPAAFSLQ